MIAEKGPIHTTMLPGFPENFKVVLHQSKKRWLCCREDLEAMYNCHSKGDEITLWCESRSTQINKRKREDDASTSTSKRQTKKSEVDAMYETVKTKHVDKFDNPKLRICARMVVGGLHESTDEPPDIPAFQGGVKKKKGSTVVGWINRWINRCL